MVDVRFWTLRQPIDVPVRMSFGSLQRRILAVVELTDTDGVTGYGETWANYPPWIEAERSATVTAGLRPLLLGAEIDLADPAGSIGLLHQALLSALWPLGRQWGAPGPIMQAISGADQALWDLAGKRLGLPIANLVASDAGTAVLRHRVPAYASGVGPEDVAGQVRRCRQSGFTAVKLRAGFGADLDRSNLVAARSELGGDGELMVDVNQAWTLDEALAMADALVDAGVAWVEEPIADPAPDDFAAFTTRTGLKVAAGENVYGRRAWLALLADPAVAVVQPDVSKQGGITELLWVCEQAGAYGKVVEPHLYGGVLAYAATLQVAACCPVVRRIELDVRPNPVRDDQAADPPLFSDGRVSVPQGAGLGVVLGADPGGHRCREDTGRQMEVP